MVQGQFDSQVGRVDSDHDGELDEDLAESDHISDEGQEHSKRPSDDDTVARQSESALSMPLNSRSKKSAAWADPDDQNIQVSLASDKRLRKLRDGPEEDTIGGRAYEARLRRQYAFRFV